MDEKMVDAIVSEIVPDDDARYVHFFEATYFRDYIQRYDRPEKLFIDDADAARSKLGLGWIIHNNADGNSSRRQMRVSPFSIVPWKPFGNGCIRDFKNSIEAT